MAAPVEQWQFSLKTPTFGVAPGDPADLALAAIAMKDAYQTHLIPRFPAAVLLTRVVSAFVDEGGTWQKTADGAYVKGEWEGSVAGSKTGTVKFPLQTALCVSLDTSRAGPTGKGRFFLPLQGETLGVDYRLEAGTIASFGLACKNFILAVSAAAAPVRVFSSKGYSSEVNKIRVGAVPDTMRSRRGDVLEGYTTTTL